MSPAQSVLHIPRVTSTILINGLDVKCLGWTVKVGSYGSIGSATLKTTYQQLDESGIDIESFEGGETVEIRVRMDASEDILIFGGIFNDDDVNLDASEVSLNCLDHAAVLVDTKTVFNDKGSSPSGIARKFAEKYGFEPVITDSPAGVVAGTLLGASTTKPSSQPIWTLLQTLARSIGFECHVTPDKKLVFGPGGDAGTFQFKYKANQYDTALSAVWGLRRKRNPRRNKTFQVRVYSYDHRRRQLTTGTAVAVGKEQTQQVGAATVNNPTVSPGQNRFIRAGIYSAGAGSAVRAQLPEGIPVYAYHINGLTPAQANERALAIAHDIAKREVIFSGSVNGLPSLIPESQLELIEANPGELRGFAGRPLTVTQIEHQMTMPQGVGSGGFSTNFVANNLPPETEEDPSTALAHWI